MLSPESRISQAVDNLLNSQETEFVVAEEGKPVGLLTRNEIVKGLSQGGGNAPVSSCMITDFFIVSPDTRLFDFFQQASEKGLSAAIVMDGSEFAGLVDIENVQEKLMIRQAMLGA